MINFTALDWVVVALFLGVLGYAAWRAVRTEDKTSEDYFLVGRNASFWLIGTSIFASNIGSEHLVGLAGSGAQSGMAMAHWELQSWIILLLGWVFVPFYWRSRVFTMPEFVERRYTGSARTFLSFVSLISYILTKVSVTVYAGGLVMKTVLGIDEIAGIDFFWIAGIGLVVLTGLYTVLGGMRAVMYTEALQAPVLLLGSIILVILGFAAAGGVGEVMRLNGENVHLWRSLDDPEFPWLGIVFGSFIIGFWYWCTDQYIVQRVLSAKSLKEARRGTILAGYFKLAPVFVFLFPGMIAVALDAQGKIDLPSPDAAFPLMVSTLLPSGLKGLVIVALLAALMSSLASLFNSSATLFTIDFYKRFRPQTSEAQLVRVGRMATFAVVVLGILWIPVMSMMGGALYQYLQVVQSLVAPGIAAIFLLGIMSKRITPMAGYVGLIAGFVMGMIRLVLIVAGVDGDTGGLAGQIVGMNWLYYCTLLFVATSAVVAAVSLFTEPASEEKLAGLTFGSVSQADRSEMRDSWNGWDIAHTVIILAITVGIYFVFW
jgi:SSS family solute:Na+ symporter